MGLLKTFKKDLLTVEVYETRAEMGAKAAFDAEKIINEALKNKEYINVVFAAAPSQNELLDELCKRNIDWSRINAFHMDEYLGLDSSAPQCFGNFLREHIFSRVPFKSVHYISDYQEGYEELIKKNHIDLVCMGIGENGHIAFNDPGEADFNDKRLVRAVNLDDICRQQQVNDGCFAKFDDVPKQALTLTVPALFGADALVCVVPAKTKCAAVERTVNGEIGEHCPATVMRMHKNAVMYCDRDSGAGVL